MEFNEKLQEIRKSKGLTQEELAQNLFVSRTAISKWESGRGYPSIDSLKEISRYFSISIDDLLSSEKILRLAEKENELNIRNICDYMFGLVDLFSFLFIVLPLYPNTMNDFVYSVNLFDYVETSTFILQLYWILFISLLLLGIFKIIFTKFEINKLNGFISYISMILSGLLVIVLSISRVAYAIVLEFVLFVIKGIVLIKIGKPI